MYFVSGLTREAQPHPVGPGVPVSPPALHVVFVLWQAMEAHSSQVLTNEAKVIGRYVKTQNKTGNIWAKTFVQVPQRSSSV